MASCTNPTAIIGGVEITTGPYADTTRAIYMCNSGYVMSGVPYVTCSAGTFTGAYPTCTLEVSNTITVTNDDDNIPTWLIYVIAALAGMLIILIITCIFVCCFQLLGCCGGGNLFGSSNSGGFTCCAENRYDPERQTEYDRDPRQCTAFPRRYLYDDSGRRFHYDDVGRICYHNHKHQNGKVAVAPSDQFQDGSVTLSNDATIKKTAKEVAEWMPHAKPLRSNNTSTK